MKPSSSMNSMSSGKHVFFIQNERGRSSGQVNSMPAFSSIAVRYMSPLARSAFVSARSMRSTGASGASTNQSVPMGSSLSGSSGSGQSFAGGTGAAGTGFSATLQRGCGASLPCAGVVTAAVLVSAGDATCLGWSARSQAVSRTEQQMACFTSESARLPAAIRARYHGIRGPGDPPVVVGGLRYARGMGPHLVRCWLALAVAGCGAAAESPSTRTDHDPVPSSTVPPRGVRPNVDGPTESSGGGRDDDVAFVEQGCTEAPMRIVSMDCDPFQPQVGCDTGQGCQPYVRYPSSPCDPEVYGARCGWVGTATQGDSCSSEACAAGFLCIATGQGTQCAQICDLSADSGCPPGLVCGSIDIEGIGTCF